MLGILVAPAWRGCSELEFFWGWRSAGAQVCECNATVVGLIPTRGNYYYLLIWTIPFFNIFKFRNISTCNNGLKIQRIVENRVVSSEHQVKWTWNFNCFLNQFLSNSTENIFSITNFLEISIISSFIFHVNTNLRSKFLTIIIHQQNNNLNSNNNFLFKTNKHEIRKRLTFSTKKNLHNIYIFIYHNLFTFVSTLLKFTLKIYIYS